MNTWVSPFPKGFNSGGSWRSNKWTGVLVSTSSDLTSWFGFDTSLDTGVDGVYGEEVIEVGMLMSDILSAVELEVEANDIMDCSSFVGSRYACTFAKPAINSSLSKSFSIPGRKEIAKL